jgi:uncharacterized protein YdhG (YjbR/CyaY superfamily)
LVKSSAGTPEEYLAGLQPERREAVARVREVILKDLPEGYEEGMLYGMISYHVPLERYPDTYNDQPLSVVTLASQKNHMSLYLLGVCYDPETELWFRERFEESGKKLDMGKSCVRFRKLEDLPLDVVGEAVSRVTPEKLIERYEASRSR